jgi:hypothetical protein
MRPQFVEERLLARIGPNRRAERLQNQEHHSRVLDRRDVVEDAGFFGQQGRGQGRQRQVLRTADLDLATEGSPAPNPDRGNLLQCVAHASPEGAGG